MKNWKILGILALLAGATACQHDCQEMPSNNQGCEKIYRPVCGCNNKTYGNACEAESVGITNYNEGACK